jgi:hypothetical protein
MRSLFLFQALASDWAGARVGFFQFAFIGIMAERLIHN